MSPWADPISADFEDEMDEVIAGSFTEVIVFVAICVVITILLCALL